MQILGTFCFRIVVIKEKQKPLVSASSIPVNFLCKMSMSKQLDFRNNKTLGIRLGFLSIYQTVSLALEALRAGGNLTHFFAQAAHHLQIHGQVPHGLIGLNVIQDIPFNVKASVLEDDRVGSS